MNVTHNYFNAIYNNTVVNIIFPVCGMSMPAIVLLLPTITCAHYSL